MSLFDFLRRNTTPLEENKSGSYAVPINKETKKKEEDQKLEDLQREKRINRNIGVVLKMRAVSVFIDEHYQQITDSIKNNSKDEQIKQGLTEINQRQKAAIIFINSPDCLLKPEQNPFKNRSTVIAEIQDELDLQKRLEKTKALQTGIDTVIKIIDATARKDIKNTEFGKEILEFSNQLKIVIEGKQKVEQNIKKRDALRKNRENLKKQIIKIIESEKEKTKALRQSSQNPEEIKKNPLTAFLYKTLTDKDYDELINAVKKLNRQDIENLNQTLPEQLRDLEFLQAYDKKDWETERKNEITIKNILDQIYDNEIELRSSERDGTTYLDLYSDTLLTHKFFNAKGAETFKGSYYLLMTLGILDDKRYNTSEKYNPEEFTKKVTEYLIVEAYARRRAEDTETESGKRLLPIEEVLTYYAFAKEIITGDGQVSQEEVKNIKDLLDKFWWNEVGRPSLHFATQTDENGKVKVLFDKYGPIIKSIENQENINFAVSREHGKYGLRKQPTPETLERMHAFDQESFIMTSAYYQLHAMINLRRQKDLDKIAEIGLEDVPLPQKDFYYITITRGNQWKKLKIDGSFFTADKDPNDPELIEKFIKNCKLQLHDISPAAQELILAEISELEEKSVLSIDEENTIRELKKQLSMTGYRWQTFDLQTLQEEAKNAYSTKSKHKEKYQDIAKMIDDPNNFTASDFGITFVDSSHTANPDPLMRSILTNTFGGRKQLNLVFGIDQKGYVEQIVETVAHKYLDGQPARKELENVLQNSLETLQKITQKNQNHQNTNPKSQLLQQLGLLRNQCTEIEDYEETHSEVSHIFTGNIEGHDSNRLYKTGAPIKKLIDQKREELEAQGIQHTDYTDRQVAEMITFRDQCNEIFSFYKEKLGLEIDKNTIVQLAIHVLFDLGHTHFLEERNKVLGPTMSFIPSRILERLVSERQQTSKTNEKTVVRLTKDEALEFLGAAQLLKVDRNAYQQGGGLIVPNAVLTGASSVSADLRKLIQKSANYLHKQVVIPLTESVLVSAVSGGMRPFKTHENFPQDWFITAIDSIYRTHGAIGLSDKNDDITITYRKVKKNDGEKDMIAFDPKKFNTEFNKALEIVLRILEDNKNHFKYDASVLPENGVMAKFKRMLAQTSNIGFR